MKKLPTSGFNEQIQYNCGIQILLHHTQRNAYETDHVLDLEASLNKFQGTGKTNIIFSKRLSSKIMNRVFIMTNRFNMNKMKSESNSLSDNYKQMVSAYTIMGSAAALECWVRNGMQESPEDIAKFIWNISKNGSSFVTK